MMIDAFAKEAQFVLHENSVQKTTIYTRPWRILLLGFNKNVEDLLRSLLSANSCIISVGENHSCMHNISVAQWLSPHSRCESKSGNLSGSQLYPPNYFDLVWVTPTKFEREGREGYGTNKCKLLKRDSVIQPALDYIRMTKTAHVLIDSIPPDCTHLHSIDDLGVLSHTKDNVRLTNLPTKDFTTSKSDKAFVVNVLEVLLKHNRVILTN